MLDLIKAFIPQIPGLLPKWMLLVNLPHHLIPRRLLYRPLLTTPKVSLISVGNSIQCYSTLHFNQRIYNIDPTSANKASEKPSSQVTALSARTFGTWTLLTAIVRLFAAYNLDHPAFYGLAFCTYLVAFMHFTLEWFVYGTTQWGAPLGGPVIVSTSTIAWMILQKGFYLGA